MIPSFRLIRLFAYGAPFWFLHALVPMGWLAPVGYLAMLGLLVLRDWHQLPRAADFSIERELPERFSFDTEQDIALQINHSGNEPVRLVICDELPKNLELTTSFDVLKLEPGQGVRVAYKVLPIRRGRDAFGAVSFRVSHRMGLLMRCFRISAEDQVRVYPRFLGIDRYDLLARIDERDEAVRIPRLQRGSGSELESLRRYNSGEDLRHVDWKVSAKRGFLVSRNLQVERGQQLAVLIDAGRFMNERIGRYARIEHALNATVMLAYVAQKRGDSIAVASFSNKVESFLPPVKGSAIMASVLESLYKIEPRQVESDYWQVVARVMDRLKRRSLMIMITDVLDLAGSSGLIRNLFRAARKHLVLCVVFVEEEIYRIADGKASDSQEAYRKAAASHYGVERLVALEQMRAKGILVLETAPEHLSLSLIRKYLEIRQADLM